MIHSSVNDVTQHQGEESVKGGRGGRGGGGGVKLGLAYILDSEVSHQIFIVQFLFRLEQINSCILGQFRSF